MLKDSKGQEQEREQEYTVTFPTTADLDALGSFISGHSREDFINKVRDAVQFSTVKYSPFDEFCRSDKYYHCSTSLDLLRHLTLREFTGLFRKKDSPSIGDEAAKLSALFCIDTEAPIGDKVLSLIYMYAFATDLGLDDDIGLTWRDFLVNAFECADYVRKVSGKKNVIDTFRETFGLPDVWEVKGTELPTEKKWASTLYTDFPYDLFWHMYNIQ